MTILVRRSNLLVTPVDAAALKDAWRHDADAVTLDLAIVAPRQHEQARGAIRSAIPQAARGGAEVFVRVSMAYMHADLDAGVWPGLAGIVLAGVESAAQLQATEQVVAALERSRGLPAKSLALIPMLESARAVWDMRAILHASPRISQAGLDESALARNLTFVPQADLDPFVYARGRLVVEATAAKVAPIGMAYPLSVQVGAADPASVGILATKAKNLGMKGVLCSDPAWVRPVNEAFTPSAELIAYNKRVRAAFAAGVAAGTAAVPLDGRMIDVPVDEWAIVVLAMAEACAERDRQKREARARARV